MASLPKLYMVAEVAELTLLDLQRQAGVRPRRPLRARHGARAREVSRAHEGQLPDVNYEARSCSSPRGARSSPPVRPA